MHPPRWFGNTRTIGQQQLDAFRDAVKAKANNPFEMLLHRSKLPMSLLTDVAEKQARMRLLGVEPFDATFGAKAQRKRPKLGEASLEEMVTRADDAAGGYSLKADGAFRKAREAEGEEMEAIQGEGVQREWYEKAGQSRRIWSELYKVATVGGAYERSDTSGARGLTCENFSDQHYNTYPPMLCNDYSMSCTTRRDLYRSRGRL